MFINDALHVVTAIPRLIVLTCFRFLIKSVDSIFQSPLRRKRPPNQVPMAIQADVSYCGGIASNFRSLPSGANVTCSSTDRLSLNDQLDGPDFLSLYPDFLSLYIGSELISFQLPRSVQKHNLAYSMIGFTALQDAIAFFGTTTFMNRSR